jgi:hypothetical protein
MFWVLLSFLAVVLLTLVVLAIKSIRKWING